MIAFARNIVTDLVEKRLWPVAVALLAALVAVPVVLGSGGEAAPTASPAPVAPSTPGTTSRAEVTLDTAAPAERVRDGRLRDPFATAAAASGSTAASTASTATASPVSASPVSASTVSASSGADAPTAPAPTGSTTTITSVGGPTPSTITTTPAPTPSAPAPSTSGSTGASDSGTGSSTPAPATSEPKTSATYEVALRFGPTDGERNTLTDVARLTALPNAKQPVVTLLGVLGEAQKAVFMVAANATASGNGDCKPSADECKTVELREGDAEYLHVVTPGRPDAWYYLKLLHIDRHRASAARAAAASVRHSRAGTAVVRKDGGSVRLYRYLPGAGTLVRAKRSAVASAGATTRVAPLLPADEQPGVVAWRSVKPAAKR
jgi:hypothetical protein